jgi:rRNA processing protein Gar1
METDKNKVIVEDWQSIVNKPVYSSNGKDIGVVRSIQPESFISSFGPVTPDKYLIPKSSIQTIKNGIIYINEDYDYVEKNFKYE